MNSPVVDSSIQKKQSQWHEQWRIMSGDEYQTEELFWEWIAPLAKEDFRGKKVLDAGCGGGHMLGYIESHIASAVGLDLNTPEIARKRFLNSPKIRIEEGDIAAWDGESDFDVVYSIGVVHHTQNPKITVKNLLARVRPGGVLSVWVYGHEGNTLVRYLVEGPKKILTGWPRPRVWNLSRVITALIYPAVYTLYSLPLNFLPYYEYFQSWKRLSFERNTANVFDKLNAPTTHFISREEIDGWFKDEKISTLEVSPWCGISWRVLVRK